MRVHFASPKLDMESPNLSELGISLNEIMNRRLKNRERQRRYRQKKRLRTNSNQVCGTNQSSEMQIMILPTDVPVVQAVTRVYCKRDWKKDARRVYAVNQEAMSNGIVTTGQSLAGAKQVVPHSLSGTPKTGETVMYEVPSEIVRRKLGRRNWKAEARAKRN